ncbi:hypothetical protein F4808DRAFT_437799 [Astrocystis sublimbata]|nr:hypothetical protein F4808DRAFT_437799 [Astrocystis sublimbata]
MTKLVKSWPYAAASTGRYRGRLEGKLECWDANGPARAIFNDELHLKIKEFILTNLQESNSFIGFSLFMVGRTQLRTSPTVLIVSDDKPRRKAAFEALKLSKVLEQYPGFHVAHCRLAAEFEDLQQLMARTEAGKTNTKIMTQLRHHVPRTDCGIYVSLLSDADSDGPLLVHDHASGVLGGSRATIGRLIVHDGNTYGVTVAHVLPGHATPFKLASSARASSAPYSPASSEFETTAMDDSEDDSDADELCSITSVGSKSHSDDAFDSARRWSSQGPPPDPALDSSVEAHSHASVSDTEAEGEMSLAARSDLLCLKASDNEAVTQCDGPENCKGVATIIHSSASLDMMLLGVDAGSSKSVRTGTLDLSVLSDSTNMFIDDDVDIVVRLLRRGPITGPFLRQPFTLILEILVFGSFTWPSFQHRCDPVIAGAGRMLR